MRLRPATSGEEVCKKTLVVDSLSSDIESPTETVTGLIKNHIYVLKTSGEVLDRDCINTHD